MVTHTHGRGGGWRQRDTDRQKDIERILHKHKGRDLGNTIAS